MYSVLNSFNFSGLNLLNQANFFAEKVKSKPKKFSFFFNKDIPKNTPTATPCTLAFQK